jgi:hypothetical protein
MWWPGAEGVAFELGKSNREIIRCLKRYVAREVFAVLTAP